MFSRSALVGALVGLAGSAAAASATTPTDVAVQLFQWNWKSVEAECEFLGEHGYKYAQISEPMEHINGTQWWTDYQPVSYKTQSKRGTRAELKQMTATCKEHGVTVIADVVLNHMTGATSSSVGFAGSRYSKFDYPTAGYTSDNFHANCVQDDSNATSTWFCEQSNLSDLATEQTAVRDTLRAYLQDLVDLGIGGFRLDSERSIPPKDVAAILDGLDSSLFIYGEVWASSSAPVSPEDYTDITNVTEFSVAGALASAFLEGNGLSALLDYLPTSAYVASKSAIAFAADHDTARTSGYLNSNSPNNGYTLATIFLLAQSYGTPVILSDYAHTSYDQGAPTDSNGLVEDTTCFTNGWNCEQRWDAIARMVGFHNRAYGTDMVNKVSSTSNRISFGRGKIAFIAINFESSGWDATLSTAVPDGSYCDIIHQTADCTSPSITVSGGKVSLTVPAYDAIAFYVA